jgi:hypothetical protein
VRNGLIRRIDKAISLIKQFALSEGIKLTAQSLTKFVNPQLSLFAKRPSQFSGKEDLQGWTNFMVGRLTYLRGKILDTKICRPPPAPPPPPTEVKPQCKLDELSYAPCPATGLYAGLEGIKNWGRLHTTERNADTDEITNEFTDNGDPLGGGIVLGYNFRPWHDSSSARSIGWTRRSTTPSRADRSSALDPIRSRRSAGKPVSSPPLACSFMASPGRPG